MGRPSRTLTEVAEDWLQKSVVNGECTESHLAPCPGGYVQTYYGSAHRTVWQGLFGPIENDLHVLHTCDNRRCINPHHLFLGTCQDNVDDMIAKGRKVISTQYRYINEEQRIEIKNLRNKGATLTELAQRYKVSISTIRRNLKDEYTPYC